MKLGILAHLLGPSSVEELAVKVRNHGFSSVQLALSKAIPGFEPVPGKLSPGLANHYAEEFGKQGVRIAVLGCYVNLMHPDEEQRRLGMKRFKEHLRFARDFGAPMVATETFGYTDGSFHPENRSEASYQAIRGIVEELTEEAERWGVNVAIEGVSTHIVHNPERIERLLKEVPSSNLGILLDPVNLLDSSTVTRHDELLKDCFHRFGDRIIAIHSKDAVLDGDKVKSVPTGQGQLNYPLFAELIQKHKPYCDIVLEGLTPEDTEQAQRFLRDVFSGK